MSDERTPLTRERVLDAAMNVADRDGQAALTMRSLAEELRVKPMSLYHHVANKDAILDGIVDLVFGEIERPRPGGRWRSEMERRAHSARAVLGRHPWAIALIETRRNPGPATLAHHDAVIASLRTSGFSLSLTAKAVVTLDAYIFGFALQEATLPFDGPESLAELANPILANLPADRYPHFVELAVDHVLQPGYDFGEQFDFGLDLILDGLERAKRRRAPAEAP